MNSDKRAEREQHRAWLRECIARCRAEVARYEKAVERRPNTYRPRLAEAQHTLGKFYWWRHTPASYRTAFRLFTQALRNYDSYRGRRDLTLNRLTLMSDLQQLSLRLDDDRAEEVLLGLLSAYESMAAAAPLVYGEDVASTFWQLGNLHADARRFGEAERMYLRALDKHAEFDGEDPHRYRPATAQCDDRWDDSTRRCTTMPAPKRPTSHRPPYCANCAKIPSNGATIFVRWSVPSCCWPTSANGGAPAAKRPDTAPKRRRWRPNAEHDGKRTMATPRIHHGCGASLVFRRDRP